MRKKVYGRPDGKGGYDRFCCAVDEAEALLKLGGDKKPVAVHAASVYSLMELERQRLNALMGLLATAALEAS